MICPRCGTPMRLALNGAYQCPECWGSSDPNVPRPNLEPRGGLLPSPPSGAAFRALQERVAKLESAVQDLRRRLQPPAALRVRFLGEIAEEPSPEEPGEKREGS